MHLFLCVKETYLGNVSLARKYLENKMPNAIISNYTLCLVAYALTLANSPVADDVLTELKNRADHTGNSVKVRCQVVCKNTHIYICCYAWTCCTCINCTACYLIPQTE